MLQEHRLLEKSLRREEKYKNGRIGAWCENDVSWGFTHKVKENVIPVYSVKNLNSLKSTFSVGPILSNVICGSALPLFPTYSGSKYNNKTQRAPHSLHPGPQWNTKGIPLASSSPPFVLKLKALCFFSEHVELQSFCPPDVNNPSRVTPATCYHLPLPHTI